jgi:nicotinamidase-related amidase
MEPIIIVDLQKAFDVPPKLVERVARYSRRFPKRVFTRFVNPPGSLFRRELNQRSCLPGTEDTELLIPPEKGDLVVTKRGYGLPPSALRRLRALGAKRATVCGIDTDACVLGVMFSLFDAGIKCRVKKDLCWSSSGLHREGMAIIEEQFPPPKQPRAKKRKAKARTKQQRR